MITLSLQPPGSTTCGQHCLAMVTGHHIYYMNKLFGHQRPTTVKNLIAIFTELGIKTGRKLEKLYKNTILPPLCIIKVRWPSGAHWVVHYRGTVYDPYYGCYAFNSGFISDLQGRYTSYLLVDMSYLQNIGK